jgi:coenzyme PQQ synthesis protein D (PqqD)
MDANSRLQRRPEVTFQSVAGEAILIRMDTGTYFSLNKVGTEFWDRLDGQQTIDQHVAVIAAKYNVDVSMVTNDLLELSGKLVAERLVDVA